MRQTRNAIATLVVAFSFLACTPMPKLVSTWSDPARPPRAYSDVVVFGIAAKGTVRAAYEDSFVATLKQRGVRARAGYSLVPPGGMASKRTLQEAIDLARPQGVIVTHLRGNDSKVANARPRAHVSPERDGKLYDYYQRVYDRVTEPQYYRTFPVLQLETSLYDGKRGTLVWSGRSQAMDPASERTTIGDVIDATTAAMADAGYLSK